MGVDRQGRLPINPDSGSAASHRRSRRPVHLHWRYIGLVFAGGAIGTLIRYAVTAAIPEWEGMSLATFTINMTGAFGLGWLLQYLSLSGPDVGIRRSMRLFVGTGILGGYTTYSTFAVDVDGLVASAQLSSSIVYGLATVVFGTAASIAGIACGSALRRRRHREGDQR